MHGVAGGQRRKDKRERWMVLECCRVVYTQLEIPARNEVALSLTGTCLNACHGVAWGVCYGSHGHRHHIYTFIPAPRFHAAVHTPPVVCIS